MDTSVYAFLPRRIISALLKLPTESAECIQEIRLRCGGSVMVTMRGRNLFLTSNGTASRRAGGELCVTAEEISDTLRVMCRESVYACQDRLAAGFITLPGGHRVGVCGSAVVTRGVVAGVKDITSLNIRIARQLDGAANAIMPLLFEGGTLRGALVASPPGGGKTTLLRDIARQLSEGWNGTEPLRVAVIDERGELASVHSGKRGSYLGDCCDVLDGYPKAEGMYIAIRSLSPQVIVCDEVGTVREAEAVTACMNAGAAVIASVHASTEDELRRRPQVNVLLESGAADRVLLLCGPASPGRLAAAYRYPGWVPL